MWKFQGLASLGEDAQDQRDYFARQLAAQLGVSPMTFLDWSDAFLHLLHHVKPGDVVLFDEISWMGAKDPTFVPKLKAWWDEVRTPIMLVLCGSVSTWIEENIIRSTSLFGRIHLSLCLEPLDITQSACFLKQAGLKFSVNDSYKVLSFLGGIPWYLEQLDPRLTADANIKRLAFEKNGLLVSEFERIFNDLFEDRSGGYKRVIEALRDGPRTLADVREVASYSHGGTLSSVMENLSMAGFVAQYALWSFKTEKPLKRKRSINPIFRRLTRYVRLS